MAASTSAAGEEGREVGGRGLGAGGLNNHEQPEFISGAHRTAAAKNGKRGKIVGKPQAGERPRLGNCARQAADRAPQPFARRPFGDARKRRPEQLPSCRVGPKHAASVARKDECRHGRKKELAQFGHGGKRQSGVPPAFINGHLPRGAAWLMKRYGRDEENGQPFQAVRSPLFALVG